MQEFTFNDWLQDKLEIDFKRDWEFDSLVDHELRKQKVKEENENREKGSVRVRYEQKQLSKETYEKIIQQQELVGLRFIELGLQQKIERFRESIRNADPGDLAEIINEEITQQTEEFNRDLVTVDGLTSPARHITLSVKKREPLPVMHIKGSEYQKLEAEFEKMENGKEFSLKGLGSLPLRERLNRTIIHQFIEFLKGWSSKFDTDKEVAAQGGLVSLMKRHYPAHWGINGPFENETDYGFFVKTLEDYFIKGVKMPEEGPSQIKINLGTKTRLASILKTAYLIYKDSSINLTKDKEFLRIVCLIDSFREMGTQKTADFISRKPSR